MTTGVADDVDVALGFIRNSLSLPSLQLLGAVLPADPWIEEHVLRPLLSHDEHGLPLHRMVYVELARGHAKTTLCAAVAVTEVLRAHGTEVICVAADLDQARLLTDSVRGQLRRNPRLAAHFTQTRDVFTVRRTGSKIRVMSSDAPSAFGIGVDARRLRIVCDELSQWPKPDLYYAMATTLPKTHDAQMIMISNAGVSPGTAWQWGVREAARENGYLFSAPGTIASWIRKEDLAQVEASVPPAIYRRYYGNEWIEEVGTFVALELWDALACEIPPLEPDEPVVLGVDAAVSGDCFAIVGVSRDRERPTDALWVRSCAIWSPEMFADGRIDFAVPEAYVREYVRRFKVAQMTFDPYQLVDMAQRFDRERMTGGADALRVWCEPFQQGADRARADSQLLALIRQGRIHHDGNAGLRAHVGNACFQVAAREDTKGRLVKCGAAKIDAVVALSMASARALYLSL